MHSNKLELLRSAMHQRKLNAFLVTDIIHVRYLTGFSGSNGVCLITPTKQYFFTDNRYRQQSAQEVRSFKIIIAPEQIFRTIAEKKLLAGFHRIGIEASAVTLEEHRTLKRWFPNCRFISTTGIIESMSAIKQPDELDCIRKAAAITDSVFEKILPLLHPGVRECDIAAEISYWHRRFGAEGDSFEPIVASGERGALPHARASEKKMKRGEFVVLDFGCRYKGYCSDITRTVAIGKVSSQFKRIYEIVLEAQQMAIEAVQPGIPAKSVDVVARQHIKLHGFGAYFFHSLGHGLGIRIHESPLLSIRSAEILQPGNVFTIEPGIYIPDKGGVRIEDDIALHADRVEVITHSPKELIVV